MLLRGPVLATQKVEKCGLAAAGRAHDHGKFSFLDLQVNAVQRLHKAGALPVIFFQSLCLCDYFHLSITISSLLFLFICLPLRLSAKQEHRKCGAFPFL